jgi:hypothetical protein
LNGLKYEINKILVNKYNNSNYYIYPVIFTINQLAPSPVIGRFQYALLVFAPQHALGQRQHLSLACEGLDVQTVCGLNERTGGMRV